MAAIAGGKKFWIKKAVDFALAALLVLSLIFKKSVAVMCFYAFCAYSFFFFFFNDTATPEIYPLSLHDALPIFPSRRRPRPPLPTRRSTSDGLRTEDRKSTRLNSSHLVISYAVFCLKKKKK